MFRLLKHYNDLLSSKLYDESGFYPAFIKDAKRAKKSIVIESPFLTEKRAIQFCRVFKKQVKRGVGVAINTRHPHYHDSSNLQAQSWKAMRILTDSGVKVYMCRDMRHRKLAIIDERILWEGSLNILSQGNSKEIMRRSSSSKLAVQMLGFTKMNAIAK